MKKVTYSILSIILFTSIQAQNDNRKTMEINGHIMMDSGYDFGKIDPEWFDTMRPTKLLDAEGNEFQNQGNMFFGVRQTTLSIKNYFETSSGTVKTVFEFDLFGSGKDAGATAFHLRHAYIKFGKFIAGQTNSVFADMEVYPNLIEFMGPSGAVFTRNIQIRYTPISTDKETFAIALERPGATGDKGEYGEDFEYASVLDDVAFRFAVPDLSAEYRYTGSWGYLELAGIVRSIRWEDNNLDAFDIHGSTTGWGLTLSTKLQISKNIIFWGAFTKGAGIQNYMNDADADVGTKRQYGNPLTPIDGEAIPVIALAAYFDIQWNPKLSTAMGYSIMDNTTTDAQLSTAYKTGQYSSINILYSPIDNLVLGPELQWGKRTNNDFAGDPVFDLPAATGNTGEDLKIQFSVRYAFTTTFHKNR